MLYNPNPPRIWIMNKWVELKESLIDFAQPELDLQLWNRTEDGSYYLSPNAEKVILDHLRKHPEVDLSVVAKEPHIVGSMTTNQYLEDSDIDVHPVYIGKHGVEVYVQLNPPTDYLSPGYYDINTRKWRKGPKLVPTNYDPYEDFSDIADELKATVQDADLLLGEIRRDIIDVEVIQKAIEKMSSEDKKKFLTKLEAKYAEIEADIKKLLDMKKDWVGKRRVTEPVSPEEALKDVELAKEWRDSNALFKLIGRYQYITIIKALKNILSDDGEISAEEIDKIQGVLGA
jgi:hypothetical protein